MSMEIILLSYIYMIPLSAIGTIALYLYILQPRIQTRRGYIKITRVLPSGHLKDQWVKPVEETITEEEPELDENGNPIFERGRMKMRVRQETGYLIKIGKKERIPYIDSPNFTYFQGPVKRAFYDSEGSQLSINEASKLVSPTSAKMIDTFGQRMFNVGRMAAFAQKRNIEILILITAALAAGSLLVSYYNYGMLQQVIGMVGG